VKTGEIKEVDEDEDEDEDKDKVSTNEATDSRERSVCGFFHSICEAGWGFESSRLRG